MSKDTKLSVITKSLQRIIKEKFSEPITVYGKIMVIEQTDDISYFSIRSKGIIINCYTKIDIKKLANDKFIRATGKLIFIDINSILFGVSILYLIEEEDKQKELFAMSANIMKALESKKINERVDKLNLYQKPDIINNIGIISLNRKQEEFKFSKSNCRIYTYHLTNDAGEDLIKGIQVFTKFYHIDLIVIIADKINIDDMLSLSNKDIVKYMLNRRSYIAIVGDHEMLQKLCNQHFPSVNELDKYISNVQTKYAKSLNDGIDKCFKLIKSKISKYNKEIQSLSKMICKMDIDNPDSLQKLIDLVNDKLDREMHKLMHIELAFSRNLLEKKNW